MGIKIESGWYMNHMIQRRKAALHIVLNLYKDVNAMSIRAEYLPKKIRVVYDTEAQSGASVLFKPLYGPIGIRQLQQLFEPCSTDSDIESYELYISTYKSNIGTSVKVTCLFR
jgi:hypothetical protein